MTVLADLRIAGPYACTGGETVLSYGFKLLSAADLAVTRRRGLVELRLVYGIDYTVSGVGNDEGGNVTLVTPALDGDLYVVEGDRPAIRPADILQQREIAATAINAESDSLQVQVAELRRRLDRAVQRSPFDTATGHDTPPVLPANLRERLLYVDDAGNVTGYEGPGAPGGMTRTPRWTYGQSADGLPAIASAEPWDRHYFEDLGTWYEVVPTASGDQWLQTGGVVAGGSGSAGGFGLSVGDGIMTMRAAPRPGFIRLGETAQSLAKASYPDLHAFIAAEGYPWGSTSTHFSLPPAAGYALRFAATSTAIDPDGPRAAGSVQQDLIETHTHSGNTGNAGAHSHTITVDGQRFGGDPQGGLTTLWSSSGNALTSTADYTVTSSGVADHAHTFTTSSMTGGGAETRGKNVAYHLDVLAIPAQVASGLVGAVGYSYKWSTLTTAADPGAGTLRLNHATPLLATLLYISETDDLGAPLATSLATWTSSTSLIKGRMRIIKVGAPNVFVEYDIGGTRTDNGAWNTFALQYRASNGTLIDADPVHVQFVPTGDKGDPGTGGGAEVTDHGLLEGLTDDDHPQYLTEGRGDVRYDPLGVSSAAIAAHLAASDPHTQYALEARTVLRAMVEGWWITEQAGVVGDDTTDCTSGLTTLISNVSGLGGGILFVPSGVFRVTSLGAIPANVKIIGANKHKSVIRTTSATAMVMQANGAKITIANLTIDSTVARTAGAFLDITSSVSELEVQGVTMRGAFIGIQLNNGGAIYKFQDVDIEDTVPTTGVSFRVLGGYLVFVNDLICRNLSTARPYAHFEIINVEDMMIVNSQILSALNNLVLSPGSGNKVALLSSLGSMYDDCPGSSVRMVPATGGAIEGVAIYSPWIKGAPDVLMTNAGGGTINGVTIAETDLVGTTTGIEAVGVTNLRIAGIRAGSKSVAAVSLTNCTNFIVEGNRLGPWGAYTNNALALYLGGTTDIGAIIGNNLTGNTTAFTNAASGTNITILGNPGITASVMPGNLTLGGNATIGGTLTVSGAITGGNGITLAGNIVQSSSTFYTAFFGGAAYNTGAGILLYGGSEATTPDKVGIYNNGFQERLRIEQNGAVKFLGITTTASAANAFLDSGASNNLLRSTSSLAYKDSVEPIDPARAARAVALLEPIWYRSKAEADRSDWSWYGLGAEQVAAIDPRLVHWGYQDDDYEIVEVEREMYVRDEIDGKPADVLKTVRVPERRLKDGAVKKPDGVMYDRLGVLLIAWLQHERIVERLAASEARNAAQEARLAAIEARLAGGSSA